MHSDSANGLSRSQAIAAKLTEVQLGLTAFTFTDTQRQALAYLVEQALRQVAKPVEIDDIERNDREHEIVSWLETHGFQEAWQLSPTLVSMGYAATALDTLAEGFSEGQLVQVVEWLSATYSLRASLEHAGEQAGDVDSDAPS